MPIQSLIFPDQSSFLPYLRRVNYLEILVKLRKIIRSINLESKRIEKQFGISIPQLLCLQFLSDQRDFRAPSKDIKDYMNLNASTITGIIKRLEQKGLVARLPEPKDKRISLITLTAKGAELLKDSPVTLQEKMSKRLLGLEDKALEQLDDSIQLLVRLLDAESMDAGPLITTSELPKADADEEEHI
jgi:DNA-binding MarR family transcriptional regulator